jgi:hypothetical protein
MATSQNAIYYAKIGGQYVALNLASIAAMVTATDGTTLQDHVDNQGIHLTADQLSQLTNLAADPNSTYATQAMLAGQNTATLIVNAITDRDALVTAATPVISGQQVWVLDATGDTTVKSGAALYLYGGLDTSSNPVWYKLAEAESMDVVLDWANIVNGPTSTVAQIDQAVADMHTHANEAVLDALADDGSGNLTYNGVAVGSVIVSATQPTTQADGGVWVQPQ